MRLDQILVERGLVASRARARDLIKRGFVRVGGQACDKPARKVSDGAAVAIAEEAPAYVSRGGEKLAAALRAFGFSARGRIALDVGASTGGFTQVLLQEAAARVYAVDVGQGQLHADVKADPRVISLEAQDARALTRELIPDPVEAITADVSFISLTKALGAALALAARGAFLVALIKPQFEVGPDRVGKGGVVRDEAARADAVKCIEEWMARQPGWRVAGTMPSPILGGSGNAEFLIGAVKDG